MAAAKKALPKRRLCFVIGPIGSQGSPTRKAADWLLKHALRPVLEDAEFGYEVKRADDDADPGLITRGVLRDALTADLVIADLSAHNPNAFYELGVRHTASLPTIHVTTDALDIPFDNKDQRLISFDFSDYEAIEASKERLRGMIRAVNAEGFEVSNPVTQARGALELKASQDPRDQLIAEFQDRFEAMERKIRQLTPQMSPTTPALGSGMFGASSQQWRDATAIRAPLIEASRIGVDMENAKASALATWASTEAALKGITPESIEENLGLTRLAEQARATEAALNEKRQKPRKS